MLHGITHVESEKCAHRDKLQGGCQGLGRERGRERVVEDRLSALEA